MTVGPPEWRGKNSEIKEKPILHSHIANVSGEPWLFLRT
jgi:hypothetical protein